MIIRNLICIPVYNNPDTIRKVVLDCLDQTPFPVLVVDDGSTIPVSDKIQSTDIKSGRLHFIRLPVNQGKGSAIQAAINYGVKEGFTHLLTIDGDGQHLVHEVFKLLNVAQQYPWDLIIGNRKLVGSTVPKASKFGRKFSNFWVHYQTGNEIKDSQSGFRLYPLFRLQNIKFWTKRFDFEIEVLIRLLWRGTQVHETEIDVYYPPPDQRVSHFDKIWDNVRISILNTLLVFVSFLKSKHSAISNSLAIGLGVFIGTTPFFGLHTGMATGLGLLFRLNIPLVIIGSQISIPPLAPFLAMASIRIGQSLTHSPTVTITQFLDAQAHFTNWLLGSLILGFTLGLLAGCLTYLFSKYVRTSQNLNWTGKTRGGIFGNAFLKIVSRHLGLKTAYFCLYFVIPYFYILAPQARKSANEYWKIVRPKVQFLTRQWLVLVQLFRFGQILLDRVYQGFSKEPQFKINSCGTENIIRPIGQDDRGLVMLGAHVGGWDLAATLLAKNGLSSEIHLLQHQAQGLNFDQIAGTKGREHIKTVSPSLNGQTILNIRKSLSEGKPVAIMGDRPSGSQFELVRFFGKLVPMDPSPFRIASACGAPLLFTFGFKSVGNRYDFFATQSIKYTYSSNKHRALSCLEWAQNYANALQQHIEKYPEQWFNFFNFWSALPVGPNPKKATQSRSCLIEELHKPITPKTASEFDAKANASPVSQS